MFKIMNTEKIILFIIMFITYVFLEYIWISKILITELDFIIENNENTSIFNEAKKIKSNLTLIPKCLFKLFLFIDNLEKIPGIKLSYRSEEKL